MTLRGALPVLLAIVVSGPVLAGLWGTAQMAMAHPGGAGAALAEVLAWPGLPRAAALSIGPGFAATLLALMLVIGLLATTAHLPAFAALRRFLSPLLAVPHAAAAMGLAFVIAPSGWIARALSPWATGWQVPPDVMILGDPAGMTLTLGLVAKELPFLLLMALAFWPQLDAPRRLTLMASLGYGRLQGFVIAVLPGFYARLRLPVYAVLVYTMTTVEMGQILGPDLPPPLSVQITRWLTEAGLTERPRAAAAAGVQLALVALALGLWRLGEWGLGRAARKVAARGRRGRRADGPVRITALAVTGSLVGLTLMGLVSLALWSVAGRWGFDTALPQTLSLSVWTDAARDLPQAALTSAGLGIAVALIAVVLAFGLIRHPALTPLIYVPLVLPQLAFLPGLTMGFLHLGIADTALAVGAMHLIFVLPYAVLSLAGPANALDPRFALTAATFGATPARIFWRIRLPLLLAPVLTTAAVSFAVALAQYLPTLLAGGGRIETLTTEAVALASGGDRRLAGAYGLMQLLLPAVAFAVAGVVPRLVFSNKSALRGP